MLESLLDSEGAVDRSELLELWDQLGKLQDEVIEDPDREREVLQALHDASTSQPPRLRLLTRSGIKYAVAASLLLLFAVSWLLFAPVSQTAGIGETAYVTLPDGSTVALNSGSKIVYNRLFLGGRNINLEGEAFFDVVSGERQFGVTTFNTAVHVLGTSFNVRSWENSIAPRTDVKLVSGSVRLSNLSTREAISLSPGDHASITSDNEISSETYADADVASWRSGNLIYSDELLGVVLEDVQRRFGIGIQLSVPQIALRRINVSFHSPPDAELVVRAICGAYSLNYRRVASGYEIFEAD